MSERKFIFRGGSTELILPITPDSYRVEKGINIEIINIHGLGDVAVTGYGTLATIKISCMFPANDYSFSRDSDPDTYIDQFEKWASKKTKLRFVVGSTGVNIPVLAQTISYGEQDGTNDVYAEITLREYKTLKAVTVAKTPAASKPRAAATKTSGASSSKYKIVYGDTLCAICRKNYGDGSYAMASKLAKANGIANPNIIYAGQEITIPKPLV